MEKQRDISVKSVVSYQIQTTKRTVAPLKLTITLKATASSHSIRKTARTVKVRPLWPSSVLATRAVG